MKKPIIGLTPQVDYESGLYKVGAEYLHSILVSGGAPLVLPMTEDVQVLEALAEQCDGFVFTGGHDILPAYYGEEDLYCKNRSDERDRMEMALLKLLDQTAKPVLGICRGIQTINVGFGGSLYQDLVACGATERVHRMEKPFERTEHGVALLPGTPLRELLGETHIEVNSVHHQAVKAVAPGFATMAISDDGVIEGIYRPDKEFFLAVQWHPEWMYGFDKNAVKLFDAFIAACKTE